MTRLTISTHFAAEQSEQSAWKLLSLEQSPELVDVRQRHLQRVVLGELVGGGGQDVPKTVEGAI